MALIRVFLLVSTVAIILVTAIATYNHGMNWPSVLLADLQAMDWHTQFDVDFLVYLAIVGTWVAWREGFGARGYALGALCSVMGGVFTFPYLLYLTFESKGDPTRLVLGTRYSDGTAGAR